MTVNLAQCFDPDLLCLCLVYIISSVLCEACGPGLFGGNCSDICPSECKDGLCRPSGLCEDCSDGFYGLSCDKRCPATCPDTLCHRFNVSCKKECSEGRYGKKCDKLCSMCPGPCHWRTGVCIGNSSEMTDVSPLDQHSPPEPLAPKDRLSDRMFPFAIGIGIGAPVAILLGAVLMCHTKRRRLRALNAGAAHRKNLAEQSDVSSEPLLKI